MGIRLFSRRRCRRWWAGRATTQYDAALRWPARWPGQMPCRWARPVVAIPARHCWRNKRVPLEEVMGHPLALCHRRFVRRQLAT